VPQRRGGDRAPTEGRRGGTVRRPCPNGETVPQRGGWGTEAPWQRSAGCEIGPDRNRGCEPAVPRRALTPWPARGERGPPRRVGGWRNCVSFPSMRFLSRACLSPTRPPEGNEMVRRSCLH